MKNRILIISHGHPVFSKGGAEVASYNLHRAFLERGRLHSLYLARRGDNIPGNHATIFSAMAPNEVLFRSNVDHFLFSHIGLGDITRDFRQLLEQYSPTVVHFHHYSHLGLEMIREVKNWNPTVPVVLTLHEYLAICDNSGQMVTTQGALCNESSPTRCAVCRTPRTVPEFYFREQFIKSFFELVDRFISPSHFLIDRYVKWGVPAEKISFLENGLPAEAVSTEVDELPAGHVPRRFAYFGQINPFKGLDVLLEAVTLLPKEIRKAITVEIHGSGLEMWPVEFQQKIQGLLARTKKDGKVFGAYDPKDVSSLMRGADWMIIPSVWWENSPLVIQEAFANKRPIIASNIGGMAEKVTHGVNGLHFRVKNAADLAAAIEKGCDPERYSALRQGVPDVVSVDESAQRHLEIYKWIDVDQ